MAIDDFIQEIGKENAETLLSEFLCSKNDDIQQYLRDPSKARKSHEMCVARTHIIFDREDESYLILGYFTLCLKTLYVNKASINNANRQKMKRYVNSEDRRSNTFAISAYLIAQLGKNDLYKERICGESILFHAIKTIIRSVTIVGTKLVFLECDNKRQLIEFYERNRFVPCEVDIQTNLMTFFRFVELPKN